MKKLASVFALLLLLGGLAALISIGAHAQSGTLGLAACDQGGRFVACGPVALGANAITLPASGTTALTNIIDTRGVKQVTLWAACTQVWNMRVNHYAEDGTTLLATQSTILGATTANNPTGVFWGSGLGQSIAPFAANINMGAFPERPLSFAFDNTTVTPGTCTARLFLAY